MEFIEKGLMTWLNNWRKKKNNKVYRETQMKMKKYTFVSKEFIVNEFKKLKKKAIAL